MKQLSLLQLRVIQSIILQGILICLVCILVKSRDKHLAAIRSPYLIPKPSLFLVQVRDFPETKEKTIKVLVQGCFRLGTKQWEAIEGSAFIYLEKDSLAKQLRVGDILQVPSQWKRMRPSGNPGAFNYSAYCARQGIYFTQWIPSGRWKKTAYKQDLMLYFKSCGEALRKQLDLYINNPSHLAFAEALLIGYRKGIDEETYQDYANTGLMHLIAISGMHIGMIYFTLLKLFECIPYLKRKKIRSILPALLCIWIFACITGLPPSVLRSAFMFTLIGLGELGKRKISIYNNLSCTACLLLWFNPEWLFDPGFQLSYLAVFSLAILYKPIYNRLYFKLWPLDKLWQITSATLAAQVFTLPLTLYYFHQFPLLFLFTNLFGVVLTTAILYLEIFLLLCSFYSPLAKLIGWLIEKLIGCLNAVVHSASEIPGTRIQDIHLSIFQCMLLFALISFILCLHFYRKEIYLRCAVCCLLLWPIDSLFFRMQVLQQNKLIIFNEYKQPTLAFLHGESYCFNYTSPLQIDSSKKNKYVIEPAKLFFGLRKEDNHLVKMHHAANYDLYFWNNTSLLRIKNNRFTLAAPIRVDIVLLDNKWIKSACTDSVLYKQVIYCDTIGVKTAKKRNFDPRKSHILSEKGPFLVDF